MDLLSSEITYSIFWAIIVLLLFGGMLMFAYMKHRKLTKIHQNYETLSFQLGASLAYKMEDDFVIYGKHRTYPFRIEPFRLNPGIKQSQDRFLLKIQIPMTNPNQKYLRIGRRDNEFSDISKIDHPISLAHDAKDWLEILTNDMFFSGLILTEDVKISLGALFQKINGLLFIQDDEMVFVYPDKIESPSDNDQIHKILNLMCEIKDELRG